MQIMTPFFENSDKVCALLKNSADRPKWLYLMSRMNFVLSALNSNVKIHVEPFRIYTRLITDFIVRNMKWFRIIPTLHTVSQTSMLSTKEITELCTGPFDCTVQM